jgi:hypothetical protein
MAVYLGWVLTTRRAEHTSTNRRRSGRSRWIRECLGSAGSRGTERAKAPRLLATKSPSV